MVKIRIQAKNELEARQTAQYLNYVAGAAIHLQSPRQGTNPKYEGAQAWFIYGELEIDALIWLVDLDEEIRNETAQMKQLEAGK